jgi:hypothetical protein
MRTLARFEFALGRRIGWSLETHQLEVAPHALADANVFCSTADEGLVFGSVEDGADIDDRLATQSVSIAAHSQDGHGKVMSRPSPPMRRGRHRHMQAVTRRKVEAAERVLDFAQAHPEGAETFTTLARAHDLAAVE